ncbi:MAG: glucosamine-6-phosphate deaminase [Gemmatimonadetes bacterium]|nr:glucosamine-6-phosphate deaminase [Gemmatimonadota bacterium]
MQINVLENKSEMARHAAGEGAAVIRTALEERGGARIVVATGASQFEMLDRLVREADIDWSRVTAFHLDEYIALPSTHPASFRRYLKERLVDRLPAPLAAFHYIDGEGDPERECDRLGALISAAPIDVAFVGIGENGHLAFNDPPADFDTERPYLVADLDEACRRQQLGEGWFATLEDVPPRAISMSVRQIMRAGTIICTVPDERKSLAVRGALEGPVTPDVPASILQRHPDCRFFLDAPAAWLLAR